MHKGAVPEWKILPISLHFQGFTKAQYQTKKLKFISNMPDKSVRNLTMFDKLEKIEDLINSMLTKVGSVIMTFIFKLIPKKLINSFKNLAQKIRYKKQRIKKRLYVWFNLLRKILKAIVNTIFLKADQLQKFPVKEKAIAGAKKSFTYLKTARPKDHRDNIIKLTSPFFDRLKKVIKKVEWTDLKVLSLVLSIITLGGFATYYSAQNIYNKEFPSRKIANVQEYDYTPDYKLYERKTITIRNVKLPIFVESVNKISSITIDFSVRTSTRFARHYLEEYEYKLKDYFFTMVEAVVSDFPMETEGKEVLKETIMIEVENFLNDNNIEGIVEEVNILYIVGS